MMNNKEILNESPVLHFLLYESYLPDTPMEKLPRDSTLRKYIKATAIEQEAKDWLMSGTARNYETHRDDHLKTLCSVFCKTEKNANEE